MFTLLEKIKVKRKFQKEIKDLWMAYHVVDPGQWEYLSGYFIIDKDGKKAKVNYKNGQIIPMIKINDYIGYYKIISIKRSNMFYDGAMWDDGLSYNLKLHHIENKGV